MTNDKTLILVVNPGGLSTKLAIFDGEKELCGETIEHSTAELKAYPGVLDQLPMRKRAVMTFLEKNGTAPSELAAVSVRGGPFMPIRPGVYSVNQAMIDDVNEGRLQLMHASVLGPIIGWELKKEYGVPVFTVDPVSVDEMTPWARLSGWKLLPRRSLSHALNTRYVARKVCAERGVRYEDVNMVVAHLGSGISITAHTKGRMVDVSEAMNSGPYSPQRTGQLPVIDLTDLCFSGKFTKDQIKKKIMKEGGVFDYVGTSSGKELVARVEAGDKEADLALTGMCYQIAKEIGAMSVAAGMPLEVIAITGSLARSNVIAGRVESQIKTLAPVAIMAGEFENEALAKGANDSLKGTIETLVYPQPPLVD